MLKKKSDIAVYINEDRCKGCGLCVSFCRQGALRLDEHVNQYGYHKVLFSREAGCTGCRSCQLMCPDLAIFVFRTKEEFSIPGTSH